MYMLVLYGESVRCREWHVREMLCAFASSSESSLSALSLQRTVPASLSAVSSSPCGLLRSNSTATTDG